MRVFNKPEPIPLKPPVQVDVDSISRDGLMTIKFNQELELPYFL